MYLKRLELQGFKSFADKTVLEFMPGITAVIGPNGSGKSNISDAIRWILGEQSMKSLRGAKSLDIIFAGTQNRKSLGFAEGSLVFDNTDGSLPIEYTEVTITRKIYRSGETGYFINKVPCRLKDVLELFMDTGIGKDGYSIIGQGRVEQIVGECLKQAGLDQRGYSVHKLRHTAATLMYRYGNVDIRVLQDILGHENLGTTEIYTHTSSSQMEDAINANPLAKVTERKQQRKSDSTPSSTENDP